MLRNGWALRVLCLMGSCKTSPMTVVFSREPSPTIKLGVAVAMISESSVLEWNLLKFTTKIFIYMGHADVYTLPPTVIMDLECGLGSWRLFCFPVVGVSHAACYIWNWNHPRVGASEIVGHHKLNSLLDAIDQQGLATNHSPCRALLFQPSNNSWHVSRPQSLVKCVQMYTPHILPTKLTLVINKKIKRTNKIRASPTHGFKLWM